VLREKLQAINNRKRMSLVGMHIQATYH